MDYAIGLNVLSQHPHNFKGDGYIPSFFDASTGRKANTRHHFIPKVIEDARLRQASEAPEHWWAYTQDRCAPAASE